VGSRPRIAVHDFSGHPFQLQLSRALASRGYDVLHLHCASYTSGKGNTAGSSDDPATFELDHIDLGEAFARYQFRKRRTQERRYADMAIERLRRFRPDVIISCNVPLLAHRRIQRWAQASGIAFVFWHQDFYGTAMREAVRARLPVIGSAVGSWFEHVERDLLATSDAIVGISDDFAARHRRWGIDPAKTTIIENWAPLDELPPRPRVNEWSEHHGLSATTNLLYSGTLGMKHNPKLLVELAAAFRSQPDVRVVVISEGQGGDWLAEQREVEHLSNLVLLPYQPYGALPQVLASGDVLLAILEPSAAAYSVPSKVLTYHCAQRAMLCAMPSTNLAARITTREGSGLVVDVDDVDGFVNAARHLVDDPQRRAAMGDSARRYAERTFDIEAITDRFLGVVEQAVDSAHRTTQHVRTP